MPDEMDEAQEALDQETDRLVSEARGKVANYKRCSNPTCKKHAFKMPNGTNTLFCRDDWESLDNLPPLLKAAFDFVDKQASAKGDEIEAQAVQSSAQP